MEMALLITLELLMGLIVGFIVSDNQKGLSSLEVKVSSLLFIMTNAFVFWRNPEVKGIIFSHLAISWIVLIIGVYVGEMIKCYMVNKYLGKIQKDKILLKVSSLIASTSQESYMKDEKAREEIKQNFNSLHNMINTLKDYLKRNNEEQIVVKIDKFQSLSNHYMEISEQVWSEISQGNIREERIQFWNEIGKELLVTSEHLLVDAEQFLQKNMNKEFSVKIFKELLRSLQSSR